jgi:hypothetical protein
VYIVVITFSEAMLQTCQEHIRATILFDLI